jgi:hypothetical protein
VVLSALLLASFAARAQTPPPAEPPPTTPPAEQAPAPATPEPAPPPPPAATPPAPAQAPAPGYPAQPYAYPYGYPPYGYPYGYPPQPYAYPPAPTGYPPPPAPPSPGAPAATLSTTPAPVAPVLGARVPDEDPQADRGIVLPTAYTHPKGTVFVSSYELILLQLGMALTDDTQLSLTTVPPLGQERVAFIDLTLKTSLYRSERVRVAALGSTSGIVAEELGVLGVGRVGGVMQVCLERRCGTSLSMSTNFTLAGILLMVNGVSGIYRVGRTLSLLAELDTLVPLAKDAGAFGGAMAGGGLRWHWTRWGLDLSLMRTLGSDGVTLPVVALTYRSK